MPVKKGQLRISCQVDLQSVTAESSNIWFSISTIFQKILGIRWMATVEMVQYAEAQDASESHGNLVFR